MIIYGKNAIGKTVFSRALVDVVTHITSRPFGQNNDIYYLNADGSCKYAEFRYVFQFGDDQIEYIYRKEKQQKLIYEKVIINGELFFEYDRMRTENRNVEGIKKISPTLILDFENVGSIVNYVVANTPLSSDNPLRKAVSFVGGILSASHENVYHESELFSQIGIRGKKDLGEFEKFLKDSGINVSLTFLLDNDREQRIYFKTLQPLPFREAASSGTKELYKLYIMYKLASASASAGLASLLIFDEYDAVYHFELAEHIIKMFQKFKKTQVIFTSHNTNLLSNRFMRPDCLFIMTKNKLTSLPNATKRELREGHNLEKLYMSGEFDE